MINDIKNGVDIYDSEEFLSFDLSDPKYFIPIGLNLFSLKFNKQISSKLISIIFKLLHNDAIRRMVQRLTKTLIEKMTIEFHMIACKNTLLWSTIWANPIVSILNSISICLTIASLLISSGQAVVFYINMFI